MKQDAVIFAVAGDSGGASAIAPVISMLRDNSRSVVAFAYRQARSVWTACRIPFQDLEEDTDTESATCCLESFRVALLLTGTSFNGVDLEKRFLTAARAKGVPSVSVLDFWSNYRIRFADDQGHLVFVPDRIAVMDEHARREMLANSFDSRCLVVTGQPAFDNLASVRARWIPEDRLNVRRLLGVTNEERLVLFASQPLGELYGEDNTTPLYPGYTEVSVLRSVVAALDRIALHSNKPITLLIRPHPREQPEKLRSIAANHVRIIVDSRSNRHDVAMSADLVVGMNTVLLVEACLLGCVVLSLQPGIRLPDPLPTNRWGASWAVYREEEIEPAIESLLLDDRVRQEQRAKATCGGFEPGATERVIALLDELISRRHLGKEEIL